MNDNRSLAEIFNDTLKIAFEATKLKLKELPSEIVIDDNVLLKLDAKLNIIYKIKNEYTVYVDSKNFFLDKIFSREEKKDLQVDLVFTEFNKQLVLTIKNTPEYIQKKDVKIFELLVHSNLKSNFNFYKLNNTIGEIHEFRKFPYSNRNIFDEIWRKIKERVVNKKNEEKDSIIEGFYQKNYIKNIEIVTKNIIFNNEKEKNINDLKKLRNNLDLLYYAHDCFLWKDEIEFDTLLNCLNESFSLNEKIDFKSLRNLVLVEKEIIKSEPNNFDYQENIKINIKPKFFNLYQCSEDLLKMNDAIDKNWNVLVEQYQSIIVGVKKDNCFNVSIEKYSFNFEIKMKVKSNVDYGRIIEEHITEAFKNYMKECYTAKVDGKDWSKLGQTNEFAMSFINNMNNLLKELNLLYKLEDDKSHKKTFIKTKI